MKKQTFLLIRIASNAVMAQRIGLGAYQIDGVCPVCQEYRSFVEHGSRRHIENACHTSGIECPSCVKPVPQVVPVQAVH